MQTAMTAFYVLAAILVTCLVTCTVTAAAYDVMDSDYSAPSKPLSRRPDSFRNLEELNEYLAEMKQYYALLGRPRFGRSIDHVAKLRQQLTSSTQDKDGGDLDSLEKFAKRSKNSMSGHEA